MKLNSIQFQQIARCCTPNKPPLAAPAFAAAAAASAALLGSSCAAGWLTGCAAAGITWK